MNNKRILKQNLTIFLIIWFSFTFIVLNASDCGHNRVSKDNYRNIPEKEYKSQESYSNLHLISFTSTSDVTAYYLPENDLLLQGGVISGLGLIIEFITVFQKSKRKEKEKHLTGNEEDVLSIIHEYLSENRYFEVNSAKNIIFRRLSNSENSLNANGVENIIQSLICKNQIAIGSKYVREEILDNENRSLIYSAIVQNPGIHFMKLVNLLGLSIYLVKWHLGMLEKFDFINKATYENREIFYDCSVSEATARRNHFLSRKKTSKILNYLSLHKEGLPKYKISKGIGIHYNTATKYLKTLIEFGIVGIRKQKNATYYLLL